ncbi:unnamed protein product [Ranitomeya imitator]|uniref:Uncharacterized protein n=1 Tax=Ranitomeya imitator TaxID=111125 RepID=A0ABN9M6E1_9NEOB|nr:unnamed protein product [Ranitomeya imitator]
MNVNMYHFYGNFASFSSKSERGLPLGLLVQPGIINTFTPAQGKIALRRRVLWRTENELQSNIAASMQPAGPANTEVCSQALAKFKDVMAHFSVPLSPKKTIGPVSIITFLGIEIDSIAMKFRLPQEKIDKLLELINGCISDDVINGSVLQEQPDLWVQERLEELECPHLIWDVWRLDPLDMLVDSPVDLESLCERCWEEGMNSGFSTQSRGQCITLALSPARFTKC